MKKKYKAKLWRKKTPLEGFRWLGSNVAEACQLLSDSRIPCSFSHEADGRCRLFVSIAPGGLVESYPGMVEVALGAIVLLGNGYAQLVYDADYEEVK